MTGEARPSISLQASLATLGLFLRFANCQVSLDGMTNGEDRPVSFGERCGANSAT